MKLFSENIYILILIDTQQLKLYNISVKKIEIRKLVNKMKEFIAILIILSIIVLFLIFALMIISIIIDMLKEIKQ